MKINITGDNYRDYSRQFQEAAKHRGFFSIDSKMLIMHNSQIERRAGRNFANSPQQNQILRAALYDTIKIEYGETAANQLKATLLGAKGAKGDNLGAKEIRAAFKRAKEIAEAEESQEKIQRNGIIKNKIQSNIEKQNQKNASKKTPDVSQAWKKAGDNLHNEVVGKLNQEPGQKEKNDLSNSLTKLSKNKISLNPYDSDFNNQLKDLLLDRKKRPIMTLDQATVFVKHLLADKTISAKDKNELLVVMWYLNCQPDLDLIAEVGVHLSPEDSKRFIRLVDPRFRLEDEYPYSCQTRLAKDRLMENCSREFDFQNFRQVKATEAVAIKRLNMTDREFYSLLKEEGPETVFADNYLIRPTRKDPKTNQLIEEPEHHIMTALRVKLVADFNEATTLDEFYLKAKESIEAAKIQASEEVKQRTIPKEDDPGSPSSNEDVHSTDQSTDHEEQHLELSERTRVAKLVNAHVEKYSNNKNIDDSNIDILNPESHDFNDELKKLLLSRKLFVTLTLDEAAGFVKYLLKDEKMSPVDKNKLFELLGGLHAKQDTDLMEKVAPHLIDLEAKNIINVEQSRRISTLIDPQKRLAAQYPYSFKNHLTEREEEVLSSGQRDFDIQSFPLQKLTEKAVQEKLGMTQEQYYASLKALGEQGPSSVIKDSYLNNQHLHPIAKTLRAKIIQDFEDATTLDDFYSRAVASFEAMKPKAQDELARRDGAIGKKFIEDFKKTGFIPEAISKSNDSQTYYNSLIEFSKTANGIKEINKCRSSIETFSQEKNLNNQHKVSVYNAVTSLFLKANNYKNNLDREKVNPDPKVSSEPEKIITEKIDPEIKLDLPQGGVQKSQPSSQSSQTPFQLVHQRIDGLKFELTELAARHHEGTETLNKRLSHFSKIVEKFPKEAAPEVIQQFEESAMKLLGSISDEIAEIRKPVDLKVVQIWSQFKQYPDAIKKIGQTLNNSGQALPGKFLEQFQATGEAGQKKMIADLGQDQLAIVEGLVTDIAFSGIADEGSVSNGVGSQGDSSRDTLQKLGLTRNQSVDNGHCFFDSLSRQAGVDTAKQGDFEAQRDSLISFFSQITPDQAKRFKGPELALLWESLNTGINQEVVGSLGWGTSLHVRLASMKPDQEMPAGRTIVALTNKGALAIAYKPDGIYEEYNLTEDSKINSLKDLIKKEKAFVLEDTGKNHWNGTAALQS